VIKFKVIASGGRRINKHEGERCHAYSEDFPGVYGLGKILEEAKRSTLKAMRPYISCCR
jgi:hypothetical protein